MAEKSSAQSAKQRSACVEFVKKYKSLTAERLFLDERQRYFFFTRLIWKKKLLGVEVATEYHVLDRAINISLKLHVE